MAKYVFPAVFEKTDDGYDVSFPDIEPTPLLYI